MKYLFLAAFSILIMIQSLQSQTQITRQSFENETNAWTYICNPTPFTSTDASWNVLSTEITFSTLPASGSHFFGVKDLNSPSGTTEWGILHFQEVDISSYQSVNLQFNYECIGYDTGDDIKYQLKLNSYLQPEVLFIDGYNNLSTSGLINISIPDTVQMLEIIVSVKQNGTTDYAGFDDFMLIGTENVIQEEPDNYPINFHSSNYSPTGIDIYWDENQGFYPAAYYLLIISTSPIIFTPDDHTAIQNDLNFQDGYGVVNLSAGTSSYSFNGLAPSTEYSFRIFPYSNTGQDINYKTDGDPPSHTASTFILSSLFLSEISDPADLTTARFVEIHNASEYDLSFPGGSWNLCKQTNGSTWACVALTGSIQANKSYVVAYNQTGYQTAYHSIPNQSSSSVVTGNGNDAYFLFYGGNYLTGQLVDQYGSLNTDGAGSSWEYTDSKSVRKLSAAAGAAAFSAGQWRIHSANAADCHPGFYGTIFTGSSSVNWNDSMNWENGIPIAGCSAWVTNSASNFPVISQPAAIRTLILEDEIELIGQQLLAVSDKTLIETNIPAYTPESDRWFLLAAPVSGMPVTPSDFTSGSYDFYSWNEAENSWHNQKNIAHSQEFSQFQPGAGYLVAYDTSIVRSFQGELVQSDIHLTNLSKINDGWHLLGNPFPHSIPWATSNWSLSNVSQFAYLLNESGSYYELLFPGDIIPSRQGFWTKAIQPNASLTIPLQATAKGLYETSDYTDLIEILFKLQNVSCSKLYLQMDDAANLLFEENEDAAFLSPISTMIPQIYMTDNQSNRMIFNRMPYLNPCIIPFSIINNSSEEINLQMSLQQLPDSLDWFISQINNSQHFMPSRDRTLSIHIDAQEKLEFMLHLIQLTISQEVVSSHTLYLELNSQLIPLQLQEGEQILTNLLITENGDQIMLETGNFIQVQVRAGMYFLITQTSQRRILNKIIL